MNGLRKLEADYAQWGDKVRITTHNPMTLEVWVEV